VDPAWVESATERYDPPLSRDGVEQARRLGQRLAREEIAAIVVSPFLRTVQTAQAVNESLDVPIYLEPGFGEWLAQDSFERVPQLKSLVALQAEAPRLVADRQAIGALAWPETQEQMRRRVQRTLSLLLEEFDGTLLVVGHAASVAVAVLSDTRIVRIECPLCALFCLEYDGDEWRLVLDADIAHVGERLATFAFP
jgi:broad specificity phosphatase PhoE